MAITSLLKLHYAQRRSQRCLRRRFPSKQACGKKGQKPVVDELNAVQKAALFKAKDRVYRWTSFHFGHAGTWGFPGAGLPAMFRD
jgi:hypothetical protein